MALTSVSLGAEKANGAMRNKGHRAVLETVQAIRNVKVRAVRIPTVSVGVAKILTVTVK